MKILQINTNVNSGSTGRIAEDIGKLLIKNGHESYIAYGRGSRPSESELLKIGNDFDIYAHGLKTIFTDKHGFGSKKATLNLIKQIEKIKPDAIGLHNLHGYYLNIEVFFNFLSKSNIPVLWTLFDCWAFTGHCTYFDDINCVKWLTHCEKCPKHKKYPTSWIDNSFQNFENKKYLFKSLENLELIVHSKWLANFVSKSFLVNHKIHVTPSGIDLDTFQINNTNFSLKEKHQLNNKSVLLGVASIWDKRKGLDDFIALSKIIDINKFQIILIGLRKEQINNLPPKIIGIERTENLQQLADYYNLADIFINPTWQDNFPTTNIESLACGTPIITYNTGGSPEAIDEYTGLIVEKGDIVGLQNAVKVIIKNGKDFYQTSCRKRAELLFNKNIRYMDYLNLYESMINKKND